MNLSDESTLFVDDFATSLGTGWSWRREHPNTWRIRESGLEIRVEPGVAATVHNALCRKPPSRAEGPLAIEVTVCNLAHPTQQYEQAGITWYCDGSPVFKVVKELIDGDLYIIPGRQLMTGQSVRLRLLASANSWEAQYRPEGEEEFRFSDRGELPPPCDDEVSIQCYNGPADAEHWIRFSTFCIKRLP